MARRSSRMVLAAAVLALAGGMFGVSAVRAISADPPTIVVSFDAQAIGMVNGWSTLTITIANPNGIALTDVAFTDTLSAGIIFANPDSLTQTCYDGTFTTGVSTVTLTGGVIPARSSCTFRYDVLGVASGTQTSTTSAVTSYEGLAGSPASTNILVAYAPTTTAVFGDASIPFGGSTTLTFTVANPNPPAVSAVRPAAVSVFSGTLSGIGFVDTLPAGLVVADPNGLIGDCGGGVITATAGSGTVTLAGASLPAGASCTFVVNVTGMAPGTKQNSTGSVGSTEGGAGDPGTGAVTVGAPAPTPTPKATLPSTDTAGGSGSDGGAPAMPLLLLLAAIGVAVAIRVQRSAKVRG